MVFLDRRWDDESGQAVPFGAAMVALALMLTIAVGALGRDVVDAARARTAADAAALAAVTGGPAAAHRLAAANGAAVVDVEAVGRDVLVRVRVGDAVATARATGGDVIGGAVPAQGAAAYTGSP